MEKRGRWVTIRGKDQRIFRGKGKEIKKFNILKIMNEAAKRKKENKDGNA